MFLAGQCFPQGAPGDIHVSWAGVNSMLGDGRQGDENDEIQIESRNSPLHYGEIVY